jgi:O-antigen/teichoic acid export membrane protein
VKKPKNDNAGAVFGLRLVLRTGSIVFGLSAVVLIANPALFNSLLGLTTSPELEWSMRMIGITLVALAGNMFSVSHRSSEESVKFSARVMVVSASALGVITLCIPAPLTWFAVVYAVVGFVFSAAYGVVLLINERR